MDAYEQLLYQFHEEQQSKIDEQSRLGYEQLLNQLRSDNKKKQQHRKKILLQASMIRSETQSILRQSRIESKIKTSRVVEVKDMFEQRKSMIELEKQTLLKEINQLNVMMDKLKEEKTFVKSQLGLIASKQTQIETTLNESLNILQQLKSQITLQRQQSKKQQQSFEAQIQQMTENLLSINQQNAKNSQYYKQLKDKKSHNQNNKFLGHILQWTTNERKLKQMKKKIFTKMQIENMLRVLYVVKELARAQYGDVIEDMVRIAERREYKMGRRDRGQNMNQKQPRVFVDERTGEQLSITQVIKIIQDDLLSPAESKLLSKYQLLCYYSKKGISIITSQSQPLKNNQSQSQMSSQTYSLINQIVNHFTKLTSWFGRVENRHLQLSKHYKQLTKLDDELSKQIKVMENSSKQKTINYLLQRQAQIQKMQEKLHQECKVLFLFNINIHSLIKRMQNLNRLFDQIVKSTQRKTYKKTFVQIQSDKEFLKQITKELFKSPELIIMQWNQIMKEGRKRDERKIQKLKGFELENSQISQSELYLNTIMGNDLLRIYAQPFMYSKEKPFIENVGYTFDAVISQESVIVTKLLEILKGLIKFSKNGIQQVEKHQIPIIVQKVNTKKRISSPKTFNQIPQILQLVQQQQATAYKFDKFLNQDGIKEEQTQKPQTKEDNFCVESNDYYRRDNFKLIEKLEKLNLKKRGLLPKVPFFVDTSLELEPNGRMLNKTLTEKSTLRFRSTQNTHRNTSPRMSHQLQSTRHNLISEMRQRDSSRKKDLKALLGNISNIASQNRNYRIKKQSSTNDLSLTTNTSRVMLSSTK